MQLKYPSLMKPQLIVAPAQASIYNYRRSHVVMQHYRVQYFPWNRVIFHSSRSSLPLSVAYIPKLNAVFSSILDVAGENHQAGHLYQLFSKYAPDY